MSNLTYCHSVYHVCCGFVARHLCARLEIADFQLSIARTKSPPWLLSNAFGRRSSLVFLRFDYLCCGDKLLVSWLLDVAIHNVSILTATRTNLIANFTIMI